MYVYMCIYIYIYMYFCAGDPVSYSVTYASQLVRVILAQGPC